MSAAYIPSIENALIMVVDDTPVNLQMTGSLLYANNFRVIAVPDGKTALASAETKRPDLILLDVAMPEMDGMEVCLRLKANEKTKDIPIIFLTAHGDKDNVIRGFSLGAVDYVSKPYNATELLSRVRTHLEIKCARESLARQNEELRLLNEEKNEFLGLAAHGIKNPLTGIMGLAEFLYIQDNLPSDRLKKSIKGIWDGAKQIHGLVKNLLDVSRIESQGLEPEKTTISVLEIVERVIREYEDWAKTKDITLVTECSEAELSFVSDKLMVEQIAENLVSNAIKYSPRHSTVTVRVIKNDGAEPRLRLEVRDQGPGIAQEEIDKLFHKFSRLSAQPTGGEHSSGLGLAITKRLVLALEGAIWCESALGEGANFIVELPNGSPKH